MTNNGGQRIPMAYARKVKVDSTIEYMGSLMAF
jgi:hypothetical protein